MMSGYLNAFKDDSVKQEAYVKVRKAAKTLFPLWHEDMLQEGAIELWKAPEGLSLGMLKVRAVRRMIDAYRKLHPRVRDSEAAERTIKQRYTHWIPTPEHYVLAEDAVRKLSGYLQRCYKGIHTGCEVEEIAKEMGIKSCSVVRYTRALSIALTEGHSLKSYIARRTYTAKPSRENKRFSRRISDRTRPCKQRSIEVP